MSCKQHLPCAVPNVNSVKKLEKGPRLTVKTNFRIPDVFFRKDFIDMNISGYAKKVVGTQILIMVTSIQFSVSIFVPFWKINFSKDEFSELQEEKFARCFWQKTAHKTQTSNAFPKTWKGLLKEQTKAFLRLQTDATGGKREFFGPILSVFCHKSAEDRLNTSN